MRPEMIRRFESLGGSKGVRVLLKGQHINAPAPAPVPQPEPEVVTDPILVALEQMNANIVALTNRFGDSSAEVQKAVEEFKDSQGLLLAELRKPVVPRYDPKTKKLIGVQRVEALK